MVTELSNNKENDNNEQEISEMQFDNFSLKSNARASASRSKAKQNHRDVLLPAHPQDFYPSGKEIGLMFVEPEDYSPVDTECQNN